MSLDDDGAASPERPPSPLDDVRKSLDDVGKSLADVGRSLDDVRQLTDSQTLRALTHPVRIALIEALLLGGAMTAMEVGERISEVGHDLLVPSAPAREIRLRGGGGRGRRVPAVAVLTATGMQFSAMLPTRKPRWPRSPWSACSAERQFARYQTG